MKKLNRMHFLCLLLLFAIFTSCQKENQLQPLLSENILSATELVIVPQEKGNFESTAAALENVNNYNTFYGPQVQMGNGHLRSWINITRADNKPLAIGIEFTANSFWNLPDNPTNFEANTFVLRLHQKALAVTPFDHITIDWNPEGHHPAGVYDIPHFDMHFYKITLAQQMAISPVPGPFPPAGYLPASYVIQGATVPQMGTHWLSPSFPELPPTLALFTHTLIYGTANAQTIFIEPMITRDFLLAGSAVSKAIAQPIHFSPSGTNYPTIYKIWKDSDNGRHYVALTDFVWR